VAFADTAELAVRLTLDDKFSRQLGRAQGSLGKFQAGVGRAGRGVGQLGAGFARVGTIAAGIVAGGFIAAAKQAIDFDDAMAGVRKTVDETELAAAGLTFEDIARSFRDMATEIPISAVELAKIGETAGALGIRAQDIDDFTRTVALLGVTTDLTSDAAAEALGKVGTILGLTGTQFQDFADILVNLGNQGASTESEIIEVTKRFAGVGKQAGLTTPQILALASAMTSLGAEPEAAGGALSRIFSNMATEIANGTKKGKAFAKVTGKSLTELRGMVDKGQALPILLDTLKGIAGLSRTEQASVLKALGITDTRARDAIVKMAQNLGFVNDQLTIAGQSTGSLGEEAAKKFATTAAKIAILKGNLVEAAITMGEQFAPAIGRAAEKLSAFLKQPEFKAQLAALGKDIGAFIDGIDWAQVMTGAREFAGLLKDAGVAAINIVKALNILPTEVKALGLGLIGLNKLSGGLVGAGLSNIIGGLAEPLVRNLAASIPLFGRAFVQPVFVTNMGAGFPGAPGGGGPPALPPGAVVPAVGATVFIDKAQWNAFLNEFNAGGGFAGGGKARGNSPAGQRPGPTATDAMAIHGPAIARNTAATAARVGAQGAQQAATRERLAERLTAVQQASVLGLGGVRNGIATVGLRVAGTTAALGTVAARISTQTAATSAVKTAVGTVRSAVGVIPGAIARNPPRVAVTANTYVTTNVSVRDLGINSSRKSKFGYSHL
jgi:TP901 family phage tail tape measure protein